MSLNPKHINRQLNRYFNGDMTGIEMHELEKQALSDSFLKDAMDGYSETPQGLQYFNRKIANRFSSRFKYWTIASLSIALLVMTGLYFTKKTDAVSEQSISKNNINTLTIDNVAKETGYSEIEIIPDEIETLQMIESADQIKTKAVKNDFSTNETYHAETQEKNENIVLIDPNDLLVDEELPEIIVARKAKKKVIYPYRYFYDMAVVDYSRFENREKIISKTVYRLSGGLDASFENSKARDEQELVEKTVQVGYLDYLEETLYYFSKDKYKNALKRVKTISNQYKNDLNALFYGGLCYYNLGDFSTALIEFNTILQLTEGPFTEEAQWYKAKTLIKLNEMSDAKNALADIILFNGYYAQQAGDLLGEIK
ncbi:MAG: tol-pal system YbgF family protein [Crocinitomicaceae bacterium]